MVNRTAAIHTPRLDAGSRATATNRIPTSVSIALVDPRKHCTALLLCQADLLHIDEIGHQGPHQIREF